jgi:hypothetical protein
MLKCVEPELAAAHRRIVMLEETVRRIREQLWYMEHSPTRETIRMIIDAALETKVKP